MLRTVLFVLAIVTGAGAGAIAGEEVVTTQEDQKLVSLTVYNDNLALVVDQRQVKVPKGQQVLAFREVSGRIKPETALVAGAGLQVIEQNFEYDLLSPQSLLQKYVGREVNVVKTHPTTGEEHLVPARVLSADNGLVLQVGDQIETGLTGRLVFPDVPKNLRDRPTLTMQVVSDNDTSRSVALTYLTEGLSWKADYVARLQADEKQIDLNGWVTLANESGASFPEARLQLVAGEVNRVRDELQKLRRGKTAMLAEAAAPSQEMSEESMFEYHLYTLNRQTTIADNQQKQIALLGAEGVHCRKEFVLEGRGYYYSSRAGEIGQRMKVGVFVELKNDSDSGLGMPLPGGTVRVYKQDSRDALQFIGEDRIGHTPENEKVRLKLGNAFDVTADKRQTDFKKLAGFSPYNYIFESAYAIRIKNGKQEAVTVKVLEPVPGDWQVLETSVPYAKESATTVSWNLEVPAKDSVELVYRIKVKY